MPLNISIIIGFAFLIVVMHTTAKIMKLYISMKFEEFAKTNAAAAISPTTVGRNPQKAYSTYLLFRNFTKNTQIMVMSTNDGSTTAVVATTEPHTDDVAA